MKENIEVKDVQRTEYLDKNGLDMLWAKVKENTHNQVEVEYNRAKAKEDSLSQEIASVKPAEGKVFLQVEDAEDGEGTKILKDDSLSFGDYRSQQAFSVVTSAGFSVKKDAQEVAVLPTGIKADVERESDTKVWNTNGGITDLANYAKKTDIPEVNTSDFVSKTATDDQVIKSTLISDKGFQIPYIGSDNAGASRIELYVLDNEPMLSMYNDELSIDSELSPSKLVVGSYGSTDCVTIDRNGISNPDNNANHVYATDGSIADLTLYAKKSELPTAATKEKLGVVKVGDGLNVTNGTVSVDPEYLVDMMSYGVEWDTTVADPTCTRIGNPLYHKQLPIQSQYKGCLVKDGAVNYYLDPNDWSKKADGTPSVLDGTDGDVMVHIPKFYGKSGSNGNKRWVRIATTKIDLSWVEIPEMFVSAYKVTLHKDTDSNKAKVASVVNTTANYRGGSNRADYDKYLSTDKFRTDLGKPRTNISCAQMRTNASNFGQELLCYEFYKWVFYWAYVIEYANFDSQKEFNSNLTSDGYHQGGLGRGVTNMNSSHINNYNSFNPITPCGYTNEFGNFSGVKQMVIPAVETDNSITIGSDTTLYANRWRGFENPFGDIWTNLDGIVLKRDSANAESKVYTTTDSSKFGGGPSAMNVAGIEVATDGFTKEFDLGETGEIIPQLVGVSESTYKCDYHWCNASSTDTRTLLVGGDALNGGGVGLGAFYSGPAVGNASSNVGFRFVVRA